MTWGCDCESLLFSSYPCADVQQAQSRDVCWCGRGDGAAWRRSEVFIGSRHHARIRGGAAWSGFDGMTE